MVSSQDDSKVRNGFTRKKSGNGLLSFYNSRCISFLGFLCYNITMEQVYGNDQDISPLDLDNPAIRELYQEVRRFELIEKDAGKQKKAALMALRELGVNWEDTSLEPDKPFFDTILTKDQLYEIGTNIGYPKPTITKAYNSLRRQAKLTQFHNLSIHNRACWDSLFDEDDNISFNSLAILSDKDLYRTRGIGKKVLEAIRLIVDHVKMMPNNSVDGTDELQKLK